MARLPRLALAALFSGRISAAGRTSAAHCAPDGNAAPTGNVAKRPDDGGVGAVVVGAVVGGGAVVVGTVVVGGAVVTGGVFVTAIAAAVLFQWMSDLHPVRNTPTLTVYVPATWPVVFQEVDKCRALSGLEGLVVPVLLEHLASRPVVDFDIHKSTTRVVGGDRDRDEHGPSGHRRRVVDLDLGGKSGSHHGNGSRRSHEPDDGNADGDERCRQHGADAPLDFEV